jgi:hypothetical protein
MSFYANRSRQFWKRSVINLADQNSIYNLHSHIYFAQGVALVQPPVFTRELKTICLGLKKTRISADISIFRHKRSHFFKLYAKCCAILDSTDRPIYVPKSRLMAKLISFSSGAASNYFSLFQFHLISCMKCNKPLCLNFY